MAEKYNTEKEFDRAFTILEDGRGEEAIRIIETIAKQGYARAQFALGNYYLFGLHGITKDTDTAIAFYRKAAEQGHEKAQLELAMCFKLFKKDYGQAISWYRKAAESTDSDICEVAQDALKDMEEEGFTTSSYIAGDNIENEKVFKEAKTLYEECDDSDKVSLKKAFSIFQNLAKKNHSGAQYYVGYFYMGGLGVKENKKKGCAFIRISADRGNADAQRTVGTWFKLGKYGNQQDFSEAAKWFRKAASQGHEGAKEEYSTIKKHLGKIDALEALVKAKI
jgi:TPR repeat protein